MCRYPCKAAQPHEVEEDVPLSMPSPPSPTARFESKGGCATHSSGFWVRQCRSGCRIFADLVRGGSATPSSGAAVPASVVAFLRTWGGSATPNVGAAEPLRLSHFCGPGAAGPLPHLRRRCHSQFRCGGAVSGCRISVGLGRRCHSQLRCGGAAPVVAVSGGGATQSKIIWYRATIVLGRTVCRRTILQKK